MKVRFGIKYVGNEEQRFWLLKARLEILRPLEAYLMLYVFPTSLLMRAYQTTIYQLSSEFSECQNFFMYVNNPNPSMH